MRNPSSPAHLKPRHLLFALPLLAAASVPKAHALDAEVFYSRYDFAPGEANVKSARVAWDGSNLVVSEVRDIRNLPGADGLAFAPDGDLMIGGQEPYLYKFDADKPKKNVQTSWTGGLTGSYHVIMDPSETKVWTGGQPGLLVDVPLKPFGDGTAHVLQGSDSTVTQVAFDPAGRTYYTQSDHSGTGNFGTIDLVNFSTSRLFTGINGAHGMSWDPYSNTLMVYGNKHLLQIDTNLNAIVADLDLSGHPGLNTGGQDTFDQGAPTGAGQVLLAANNGNIFIVDYSAGGKVDDPSSIVAYTWLDSNVDDIAPLIGHGSRPPKGPKAPASPLGGKVNGGGRIELGGGYASFGFNANGTPTDARGHLTFLDHDGGHKLHGSVDSLIVQGTTAVLSGSGSYDGTACTFKLHVEDHGEPGVNDVFRLTINAMAEIGGTVHNGNVQLHK